MVNVCNLIIEFYANTNMNIELGPELLNSEKKLNHVVVVKPLLFDLNGQKREMIQLRLRGSTISCYH